VNTQTVAQETFRGNIRYEAVTAQDARDIATWGKEFIRQGGSIGLACANLPNRLELVAFVSEELRDQGVTPTDVVMHVARSGNPTNVEELLTGSPAGLASYLNTISSKA
jgi:hypothetical protein